MEDALIGLLETFGHPVIRQGSLAPDQAYPNTFFTFWNNDETGESFYDNKTACVSFSYDINVYSTNPNTVYSVLAQARVLLKTNGWIVTDRGYDVPSDEQSHVGRGMQVNFLQNQ